MGADAIRKATPADYDAIVTVVNDWWGRDVLAGLPRLFLDHYYTTSLIAEHDGEMTGFLIGFYSPSKPDEAYIHYVAVRPENRRSGLARRLYEEFLDRATQTG
jgi:N-acetylglutamate synthase-like GNAT family acetyltransferase